MADILDFATAKKRHFEDLRRMFLVESARERLDQLQRDVGFDIEDDDFVMAAVKVAVEKADTVVLVVLPEYLCRYPAEDVPETVRASGYIEFIKGASAKDEKTIAAVPCADGHQVWSAALKYGDREARRKARSVIRRAQQSNR